MHQNKFLNHLIWYIDNGLAHVGIVAVCFRSRLDIIHVALYATKWLFDEILDVDEAMKAAAKADTPFGQRGFFFSSPLAAKRNLPNNEIVPIDDYIEEYFKDGTLINRLKGMYTTREIAEGFSNAHKVQNFMRGETGGTIGKTFSWAYRNLLLTPKAGSQYAKTILSIPTHFRNFFSAGAFAMANGIFFENPAQN